MSVEITATDPYRLPSHRGDARSISTVVSRALAVDADGDHRGRSRGAGLDGRAPLPK